MFGYLLGGLCLFVLYGLIGWFYFLFSHLGDGDYIVYKQGEPIEYVLFWPIIMVKNLWRIFWRVINKQ